MAPAREAGPQSPSGRREALPSSAPPAPRPERRRRAEWGAGPEAAGRGRVRGEALPHCAGAPSPPGPRALTALLPARPRPRGLRVVSPILPPVPTLLVSSGPEVRKMLLEAGETSG